MAVKGITILADMVSTRWPGRRVAGGSADRVPRLPSRGGRSSPPSLSSPRSAWPSSPGRAGWHWALSSLPLGLTIAAAAGAARHHARGAVGGWLVVAMTLPAGAQLHNLFRPSAY